MEDNLAKNGEMEQQQQQLNGGKVAENDAKIQNTELLLSPSGSNNQKRNNSSMSNNLQFHNGDTLYVSYAKW